MARHLAGVFGALLLLAILALFAAGLAILAQTAWTITRG